MRKAIPVLPQLTPFWGGGGAFNRGGVYFENFEKGGAFIRGGRLKEGGV